MDLVSSFKSWLAQPTKTEASTAVKWTQVALDSVFPGAWTAIDKSSDSDSGSDWEVGVVSTQYPSDLKDKHCLYGFFEDDPENGQPVWWIYKWDYDHGGWDTPPNWEFNQLGSLPRIQDAIKALVGTMAADVAREAMVSKFSDPDTI